MKQYCIDSVKAMEEFFTDIIAVYRCTLHPDDRFTDMVDSEGNYTFPIEEALYLDIIMDYCFAYCRTNNLDIYAVAGEVQVREYKRLGLLPEDYGTTAGED